MVDLDKLRRREEPYPFQVKLPKSLIKRFNEFCKKERVFAGGLAGEIIKEFLEENDASCVEDEKWIK